MATVVLNGVTYTDDANASTGMANGGHRVRFVPCLADFVTEAATQLALQHASRDAADASEAAALASQNAAAASALSALNSPGTNATSTTSLTLGTGSKTLTIQTGKDLVVGQFVSVAYTTDPNQWMQGVITAHNAGTGSLTVNVGAYKGTGTFTTWTIGLSGPDALPAQSGNAGKYLTTSGSVASWTATTSITSVGTLTAGTWDATTIATNKGGTGLASYAIGDIVYASGTATLAKLADVATGNALISGGVGVAPSYGKVGLATHISGTLGVGNGGTNLTTYAVGDIVYASGTATLAKLPDVATGNALISGGVGIAPSYGKVGLTTHVSGTLPTANGGTNLASFTSGGAVYATSASVLATGTLPVSAGGTGATTLTGVLTGNGAGALSSAVSGTDIKTLNASSLLGSGNIEVNAMSTMQILTSGTSWVCPAGVYRIRARLMGGGGSGVSYASNGGLRTGGASGGYVEALLSVTPGNSYTYAIGAGGAFSGSTSPNAGGATSLTVGTTYTAGGGAGGTTGDVTPPAGGTATGAGALCIPGNSPNAYATGTAAEGNLMRGADSHFGSGGIVWKSSWFLAASGYGSGGGSVYSGNSQAGRDGVIILEY